MLQKWLRWKEGDETVAGRRKWVSCCFLKDGGYGLNPFSSYRDGGGSGIVCNRIWPVGEQLPFCLMTRRFFLAVFWKNRKEYQVYWKPLSMLPTPCLELLYLRVMRGWPEWKYLMTFLAGSGRCDWVSREERFEPILSGKYIAKSHYYLNAPTWDTRPPGAKPALVAIPRGQPRDLQGVAESKEAGCKLTGLWRKVEFYISSPSFLSPLKTWHSQSWGSRLTFSGPSFQPQQWDWLKKKIVLLLRECEPLP